MSSDTEEQLCSSMWFSIAFTTFFATFAALSFMALVGTEGDAAMATVMAIGGIVVCAANWAALRFFG